MQVPETGIGYVRENLFCSEKGDWGRYVVCASSSLCV